MADAELGTNLNMEASAPLGGEGEVCGHSDTICPFCGVLSPGYCRQRVCDWQPILETIETEPMHPPAISDRQPDSPQVR
jgi:hypothetical protein